MFEYVSDREAQMGIDGQGEAIVALAPEEKQAVEAMRNRLATRT